MTPQAIGYTRYSHEYSTLFSNNAAASLPLEGTKQVNAEEASDVSQSSSKAYSSEDMLSLLSQISGSESSLSFEQIIAHRDQVLQDFKLNLSTEIAEAEIDTTQDIILSYDATTETLKLGATHPNKTAVDKYFASNTTARQKFSEALALSKVTELAQKTFPAEVMNTEQSLASITRWVNANSANFFNGGSLLVHGQGGGKLVGIDMRI